MTVYFLNAKLSYKNEKVKHFTKDKIYKIKCVQDDKKSNTYYIQNDKKEYVLIPHDINVEYKFIKLKFIKNIFNTNKGDICFRIITVDKKYFYYCNDYYEIKKYCRIVNEHW